MKGNLCKSVLLKDAALPQSLPAGARGVVKFGDGGHRSEQEGEGFGPRPAHLARRRARKWGSEVEVASQARRKP